MLRSPTLGDPWYLWEGARRRGRFHIHSFFLGPVQERGNHEVPKANRLAGEQRLRLSPAPVLKVPTPPQRSFVPPQVPSPERPAHPPGQSSVTGPGSEEPVPPRAPGGIWRRGNSSHPGCGKVCPFTVLWHLWGRTCLPHTGQLLQGRMGDSTSLPAGFSAAVGGSSM